MSSLAPASPAKSERRTITINVNRKPVRLHEKRPTGLEIKEAAIAQGVQIQLDFQLARKVGRKLIPIADDERVKVEEGDTFRAGDGEDNS